MGSRSKLIVGAVLLALIGSGVGLLIGRRADAAVSISLSQSVTVDYDMAGVTKDPATGIVLAKLRLIYKRSDGTIAQFRELSITSAGVATDLNNGAVLGTSAAYGTAITNWAAAQDAAITLLNSAGKLTTL